MQKKILITGGAGFIGSHLANELIEQGHQVRVLDDLLAQVHGTDMAIQRASTPHKHHPDYLNPAVEVIKGNVCNPSAVRYACDGKQVRDVLYVGDLIRAILLAEANIASLQGQAFNTGGGPTH